MGIGKQIKYFRLRKGVRQEDLADYLAVSCQAVSKWETESSLPDIALLPRIAVYFGIAIDDLFRVSADEQLERIKNALLTQHRLDDCTFQSYCSFLEGLTADEARKCRAHIMLAQLDNHRAYSDHKTAILHAEAALTIDPDLRMEDAWPALLEAHQAHCGDEWLDNHFSLIEYCKSFLQQHPGNFRCLYALIENLLADRRYEEAVPYVGQLEQISGRAHQAAIYWGDILYGQGNLPAALEEWNRAVTEHPDVWQVFCDRADRMKKLGRYEDALNDYEQCFIMQNPPRISDGLYSKAQVYEQLGRFEEAIHERQRIIDCLMHELDLPEESEGIHAQLRAIDRLNRLLKNADHIAAGDMQPRAACPPVLACVRSVRNASGRIQCPLPARSS